VNLLGLFGPEKSDMHRRYIRSIVDRHLQGRVAYQPAQ
jgi:hypothetical protein